MIPPAPVPPAAPARPGRLAAAALVLCALAAGAAALEGDGPKRPGGRKGTVDDMDLALLQQGLLKIYVTERESGINEARLHELKISSEVDGAPDENRLVKPSPEQLEDMKKRQKAIFHFLLQEKTNAIQIVNLVDKVLGTEVHLPGEGRAERAILEKEVDLIDIPGGTSFDEACKIISKALGCPVEAELPDLTNFTIRMLLERTTGEAIIKQVTASLPMEWRIEGGTLIFRHIELPDREEDPAALDEEEKKALEEERKKGGR